MLEILSMLISGGMKLVKFMQDPVLGLLLWLMNGTTLPAWAILNFIAFWVLFWITQVHLKTESKPIRALASITLWYLFLQEVPLLALVLHFLPKS